MTPIKKLITVTSLVSISSFALADLRFSGGYTHFDELKQGVVYGGIGYEYKLDKIIIMPEIRLGVGVGDENILIDIGDGQATEVILEIDNFISASLRGQYNLNDKFGVFFQPSLSILEKSITDDDIEFTMGAGVAFKISDKVQFEAIYESIDDNDAVSVGLRFKF